ncbi:MAG: FAD-dependent oxidoreductase [Spirochaetes bacterium]|nr:FAD-dependent oxidoreductase [Spirochaetota bacterium]
MSQNYDVIIIGSGPAGLGAAFYLSSNTDKKILLLDKAKISSGGLRNDCKQNYTYPVGFPTEYWTESEANRLLPLVNDCLKPKMEPRSNIGIYKKRADRLGVTLLDIQQAHVGTDKAVKLIGNLIQQLRDKKVVVELETEALDIDRDKKEITIANGKNFTFKDIIIAPGRAGFKWLQRIMATMNIEYLDNIVDVGIRLETKEEYYSIVKDYYDPKFIFPQKVRTFCTNSGAAKIVQEKYQHYYSVNGHAYSGERKPNGLVNFAMLKTIRLTEPVVSGQVFAKIMGQMAMQLSGGKPMMQRIGDFRLGKRSKKETFNEDLYNFKPTLPTASPGDISLAMPSKILRDIWSSLKSLDTIVPGVLHPSSIIYYPEIKTYANKPKFLDRHFKVQKNIYMIGDGAGTSRGITAAWASGIRAAEGIIKS